MRREEPVNEGGEVLKNRAPTPIKIGIEGYKKIF